MHQQSSDVTATSAHVEDALSPKVLDLEGLLQRCMGNVDLADRVLDKFLAEFDQDLEELESLIESGASEEARQLSHRLKGAAANISADRLQSHLATIESLTAESRLLDANAPMRELHIEYERFQSVRPSFRENADRVVSQQHA